MPRTQSGAATSSAQKTLFGLALLGFTSVYREGFEVVIFLQNLRVTFGSGVVLEGVTPAQRDQRDPPREHRAQPSDRRGVEHVMKKDAARQTNDRSLNQKRERRMCQGKVPIRHLAQSNARRGVENVAQIEQDRDVRVLPQH